MTLRIAITGAGGPSAVSLLLALASDDFELVAGDTDPYAPGLFLARPEHRWILHRGDDPRFVDELLSLCVEDHVDVLIPTVDTELFPLARRVVDFERHGIALLLASYQTIAVCLDKAALIARCAGICPTPRTEVLDAETDLSQWAGRCVVKPRRGSGGFGVRQIGDGRRIADVPRDGSYIVQEFLDGDEFSVDTLCTPHGEVVASVPRSRLRIESGITVTGRTLHDAELQAHAAAVAVHLGVKFVANIQFRRDAEGTPRLLEVNARFPATIPLTIAAGVNMPRLALDMLLGKSVPADCGKFRDIGMVRLWRDCLVAADELETLERQAERHRSPMLPIRLPRSA